MILRKVKNLLVGFLYLEIIFLFVLNFVFSNEFIIEIFLNLISYLINFLIIKINENLSINYFFYKKAFKKVYIDFTKKFRDLGIKNFLFNGDSILDLHKSLQKKKEKKNQSNLNKNFSMLISNTFNKNNNEIDEYRINYRNMSINKSFFNLLNLNNEQYEQNLKKLAWLPTINKNSENFDKREFLSKLIEYDQESWVEELKRDIINEQVINYEVENINKINDNISSKFKSVNNDNIENPKCKTKLTLLDILEMLKLEFDIDENNLRISDIDCNDPKNISKIIGNFKESVKKDKNTVNMKNNNLNFNYSINYNIQNNYSNSNLNLHNYNISNINFNNSNNLNSSSNALSGMKPPPVKNSFINKNSKIIKDKNILRSSTYCNRLKSNSFCKNNLIDLNRSKTINLNQEPQFQMEYNNNLTNNKIKFLKMQSDLNDIYVYIGKFITKDQIKDEEINNQEHQSHDINKYFRSVYKVFFKKITYMEKIYFELLICEDIDIINSDSKVQRVNMIDNKNENDNINGKSLDTREFAKLVHEIKTPINAILGLINDLIYKNTHLDILPNLQSINGLANYLIFLISDLTQYCNNYSYNDIEIIIDKINLCDTLNFCYDILNSLLICKNSDNFIKTTLNFKENINLLIIKSDELRIKQILLNLISNAVKFTKSGTIKVKAKIKENLNAVKISVIDNGIGIKEEDLKKLFNEREKIKETSVLNRFGSGFGLSICKTLADKLDIKLNFKSTYQIGSKFSLLIPYEKIDSGSLNILRPSINIIKSNSVEEKSSSNGITTRKNSNNYIKFSIINNSNEKTDSSSILNGYNVLSERIFEKKMTEKPSFKKKSNKENTLFMTNVDDQIIKYCDRKISTKILNLNKKPIENNFDFRKI